MHIIDIIEKKKNHLELTIEEIKFMIDGYLDGSIEDYQMSAFLMAISINGMNDTETLSLTEIFINSGDKIDLSGIAGPIVDKHSTGGVGDKTTLILAPLVASCGVKVAKMSGHSLGHTGGTIDKLESIPNFKVDLSNEEFLKQMADIGVAIISQTSNLVPADKAIYALRDVTGTTSSLPLIAASIMSKKIASGADKIVIDLKVGNGALVKNINGARHLAKLMIAIGNHYHKEVVCVLTNMNAPLGRAIGNSLEVLESVEVLKGKGPTDTRELVIVLGSFMVSLGKKISLEEAEALVTENLNNGRAYKKFEELVKAQHGDLTRIPLTNRITSIKSDQTGFINTINALKLGELARSLGAGRINKDDLIDYRVGFKLAKQVGDFVNEGDELLAIYLGDKEPDIKALHDCFKITSDAPLKELLIYEVIR